MSLAHTIMAVLLESPHSGYDLSKRFEESVSYFWRATQQQIYRELAKMEREGWVKFERVPQAGKPDKKLYQVTPVGQAELMQWFAEPSEPTPVREDLLVKVVAGYHVPRSLLVKELEHRRLGHAEQLRQYREKEATCTRQDSLTIAEQFRYLTLRRGIRYEQEWIDWCDEVLAFLETQAVPITTPLDVALEPKP